MKSVRQQGMRPVWAALWIALAWAGSAQAQLSTGITFIQAAGDAPVNVDFNSNAAGTVTTWLWSFGDGTFSTLANPSHIYQVAGTYGVTLIVGDGSTEETYLAVALIPGVGAGDVTPGTNFRWAPTKSTFKLNHAKPQVDTFNLTSVLATVDLPPILTNLPIDFAVNGVSLAGGFLNSDGEFNQSANKNLARPAAYLFVDRKNQQFIVRLSRADLSGIFDASYMPAADGTFANVLGDVTLTLAVGSQTYQIVLAYNYVSTAGRSGTGTFNPRGRKGAVRDGYFVVDRATALENSERTGHYFQIRARIARPNVTVDPFTPFTTPVPVAGTMRIQIGGFVDTIPGDRFRGTTGRTITLSQPERERGGVRSFTLNLTTGQLNIRTWDLEATGVEGTGLPQIGDNFLGFNMVVRVDFEPIIGPPADFDFQAVTSTRLDRFNFFDAFWETGRGR